ncbi:DUF4157 domain-containing protein [Streptomyces sp. NBC_00878]|uniref:eCIS core domain-containing protein n=1 Tax=Streptomyces sp. NBC_00878 TaxID=2975854 RepID=UPI00225A4049|nr:DUF4157 domain-containing protein [Streptomyces sp. NBC_00878]MCX4910487.1 DUF4157 domain-containing protein [Streptomyces sp. NBC_00878]
MATSPALGHDTARETVRPVTAAEPVEPGRRPAHPREGVPDLHRRYGNRRVQGMIQAKLDVGAVDDPLERAADRMALQVTGASLRRAPAATGSVSVPGGGDAGPGVAQAVGRMRGRGRPVPEGIRRRMESATGADLGGVRVHVGHEPDRLNDTLGARAFTVGADVFVRRSEYTPGTATGDALLAHELVHTVQQGAAGPRLSHQDAEHLHTGRSDVGHAAGAGATSATATPIAQRAPNPAPAPKEVEGLEKELSKASFAAASAESQAGHLLASKALVWQYGKSPRTDEQAEVGGGAKYLHHRKVEWEQELDDRASFVPSVPGETRDDVQPAWEHFQKEMDAREAAGENRPPWFLDPALGYSSVTPAWHPDNVLFMTQAGNAVKHPDQGDPQQKLGSTYARDTMFTQYSAATQNEHVTLYTLQDPSVVTGSFLQVNGTGFYWIFRIDNTWTLADGRFVVLATAFDVPGPPGVPQGSQVQLTESTGGLAFFALGGAYLGVALTTHVECDTESYYLAAVRPVLAVGGTADRNRGTPPALDVTMTNTVRGRYQDPQAEQSYEHTLGPWRNRLNIGDLGWDIAVEAYRRLGGDSIFTEAPHPDRDRAKYSPDIQPPAAVDLANYRWYTEAQNDNPDRFVGGRSNSTLNYMQTSSWLFQNGRLTRDECLDLMAFVIADMVVSGEHSMQERMTTVLMVAPWSPPWDGAADLLINTATATLTAWLRLIETGTLEDMLHETERSLADQLQRKIWDRDLTLIRMLVVLGQQLKKNGA